jgi:hypothetical protein
MATIKIRRCTPQKKKITIQVRIPHFNRVREWLFGQL